MSQIFFFTFDSKGFHINILDSLVIISAGYFVNCYAFPLSLRLFRLSAPLDNPQLKEMVDTFAQNLGVTVEDVLLVRSFDVPIVNAFATADRKIYISDRIVKSFAVEEIEAILAHEVAHLQDIKKLMSVRLLFSLLFLIFILGFFPLALGSVPDIRFVVLSAILGYSLLLWLIAKEKQFQRKYETKADNVAKDLVGTETYGESLRRIEAINMTPVRFSERGRKYMSHPSLEERVGNVTDSKESITVDAVTNSETNA